MTHSDEHLNVGSHIAEVEYFVLSDLVLSAFY